MIVPTEFHRFRRLVVGLQSNAPEPGMRLAAELAGLLDLDLLGLLLEDAGLRDLAAIPFARELRLLGGGWHPLELPRLADELDRAARSLERRFMAASKDTPASRFEVMRGPVARTIEAISSASDIVMIVEPASAAERASSQFSWLLEAAFRSAAAVMLVPPRVIRDRGPIVAIAMADDDPAIEVGAAIASATKEGLVVIEAGGQDRADSGGAPRAGEGGLAVQRIAAAGTILADPAACLEALPSIEERLIVMTRLPSNAAFASAIAAARQVPVLVIEGPPPER